MRPKHSRHFCSAFKTTTMKKIYLGLFVIFAIGTYAQTPFSVEIEPLAISGAPGLHSFAFGKTTSGKWLFVGGRIDGLHRRQPWAAFLASENNTNIFVVDPNTSQVWSAPLSTLQTSIAEQLQSTNQEFYQRGNALYVIGGYGYSATQSDHVTFDKLTAIDVDGLANAVINNLNINSFFRQISNTNFAVTGGQLGYLDSTFYLCGGQYFEGRYNPMGPQHGPGFIQNYTDEIRRFKLEDDGNALNLKEYSSNNDAANLHKRDYNMVPQVFPNGKQGFTMFSGVFDSNDLPWLNSVDVIDSIYSLNTSFSQYLSHYHSAKLPIYDSVNNAMHTIFFGGMSQYTLDTLGNLIQDDDVPFVKTISKVSRLSNGTMQETKLGVEMPSLLGAGAEFIPVSNSSIYNEQEILKLDKVNSRMLVGYIYGGIESTQPNIFFSNTGTQSTVNSTIFKVFVEMGTVGIEEKVLNPSNILNLSIFPNPATNVLNAEFFIPNMENCILIIYDISGKEISRFELEKEIGKQKQQLDISELQTGSYVLELKSGVYSSTLKFQKN